jgi:hypothetical protein
VAHLTVCSTELRQKIEGCIDVVKQMFTHSLGETEITQPCGG